MMTAQEALERLREGNERFVSGDRRLDDLLSERPPNELVGGQAPFAVVLGCSDSRVPVEVIFDQGLGDLFVIRVAGNVAAPSQLGSAEFAAEHFGSRLVVVLGHTGCGAVQATLGALQNPGGPMSRNLQSLVDRIRPAMEKLLATDLRDDPAALVAHGVRANVRTAVDDLRSDSSVLEHLLQEDGLRIVGAEYDLETGRVDFFEGVSDLD